MPERAVTTTNSAIQLQITALGERMDRGFTELKELMGGMDVRVRGLEQREAGCQPIITQRMDAAWKTIDQHTSDIKKMNDAIISLQQANKVLIWVGSLLGSAIVIWFITSILKLVGGT